MWYTPQEAEQKRRDFFARKDKFSQMIKLEPIRQNKTYAEIVNEQVKKGKMNKIDARESIAASKKYVYKSSSLI